MSTSEAPALFARNREHIFSQYSRAYDHDDGLLLLPVNECCPQRRPKLAPLQWGVLYGVLWASSLPLRLS
jgi:hypothetical protein